MKMLARIKFEYLKGKNLELYIIRARLTMKGRAAVWQEVKQPNLYNIDDKIDFSFSRKLHEFRLVDNGWMEQNSGMIKIPFRESDLNAHNC